VLEGRNQRRVAPGHRKAPAWAPRRYAADEPIVIGRAGEVVARRSLDGSRNPSGPAVMRRPRQQAGHMTARQPHCATC
jgi:hypothetical protein